jgi:hypothetical protein
MISAGARQHVADRKRHRDLRGAQSRQVVIKHLVRGHTGAGMHRQRDIEVFERIPQRLVKAVIQPMLADRHRIDMDRLEAKLVDAAARLAGGLFGIAQIDGSRAKHAPAGL